MEKLTFEDIAIPESLDPMVDDLLDRLPVKKRWILRRGIETLASCAGLVFILSILIYSNDSFARMAKNIPGLDLIVQWINKDVGVNHAKDSGYPILGPFVYEDGGYELILSNIMIDEKRINFDSELSGLYGESEKAFKRVPPGEPESMGNYDYMVSLLDFERGITTASAHSPGRAHSDSILLGLGYEGYIRELLDAGEPLPLKVEIDRHTAGGFEPIYIMENVEVPFDREDALLTREYALDDALVTPHGVIQFKTLEITPTIMELHCRLEPNGVEDLGFSNYRILNSDGTELSSWKRYTFGVDKGVPTYFRILFSDGMELYSPTRDTSDVDKRVRTFQIMPSLYFDKPESLTVMYDSYYYTLPVEPYTLDLNDEFPKAYDYHGYTFIVDGVTRLKNDKLSVQFHIEDGTGFKIQGLTLEGLERNGNRHGSDGQQTTVFLIEEEMKDVYSMTLDYPKIIVEQKGKVEIQLK